MKPKGDKMGRPKKIKPHVITTTPELLEGTPDAYDIASVAKKKPGRPEKYIAPAIIQDEPDNEEMSDREVDAMADRATQRKEEAKAKVEAEVDAQEWTIQDPLIPEELKGKVWIAVYRCADGHKTKATNRQAESGVNCARHREGGLLVKANIMPQFLEKPEPPDDDLEKRRKARKAAE